MTRITSLLTTLLLTTLLPGPLLADGKQREKVSDAVDVIEESFAIPDKGIPPSMLKRAKAIAVIPGMVKVGFIIGGRFGSGVLMVKGEDGKWSNPAFVTLKGGSVGLQIGAQSSDVILVFKSLKTLEGMKSGTYTLGADVGIAAGPVGRQAEAAVDTELESEIYSYARSSGLFAGISLQGAAFQFDSDANESFYGLGTEVEEIFDNSAMAPSEIVERLREVVAEGEAGKLKAAELAARPTPPPAPKPTDNPNPGKGILDI